MPSCQTITTCGVQRFAKESHETRPLALVSAKTYVGQCRSCKTQSTIFGPDLRLCRLFFCSLLDLIGLSFFMNPPPHNLSQNAQLVLGGGRWGNHLLERAATSASESFGMRSLVSSLAKAPLGLPLDSFGHCSERAAELGKAGLLDPGRADQPLQPHLASDTRLEIVELSSTKGYS